MTAREPEDIDARFAEIMSGWDDEACLEGRQIAAAAEPAPPREPYDESGATRDRTPETEPVLPGAPAQEQRLTDRWLVYRDPSSGMSMGTDHRSWSPGEDPDDEHFVPPPPAPVPTLDRDPAWWAILVGLVAGPVVLLGLVLTGHTSPRIYVWLAGLVTAAALVGLFLRLPDYRDEDDDGARV